MTPFEAPDLMVAFPEILLAGVTLLLLFFAALRKDESFRLVSVLGGFFLIALAAVLYRSISAPSAETFDGMFKADTFASYMKILVVVGAAVSIAMGVKFAERERIMRYEYPILIMLSTLGMMLMLSANDLMSLYIGLEMQSFPLYILASFQRQKIRSTEAGLKYFILGALSSGLLLYGMSLIYGYTGSTSFDVIAPALAGGDGGVGLSTAAVVGMVFMICGLAFKISAVPFHMWAPDVYEGAPTSVTAFFAIAPKIAALGLLTRVLMGPFGSAAADWQQVVIVLAVASMAWGGIAAIAQKNIKRLMAYSSIGHMGYALVAVAAANTAGVQAVVIYSSLYMIMSIGVFAVILMMKVNDQMVENISDLAGLGKKRPMLALAMTILMFSMAGIPPLAGFFGKLFVFMAAVEAKLYAVAVFGVLASVISAYYYLRIIKIMYFDDGSEYQLDAPEDSVLNIVLLVSCAFILSFIAAPDTIMAFASDAARSISAP